MHSDDPAGVPPENEQQPEPDRQSSIPSPNASPASNEPERAHQGPTTSKSAPPSSAPLGPAAIMKKLSEEEWGWWVRGRRREERERKRANDIRLPLERLHAQLSDAIKDTEYLRTLELTTEEREYVNQMFEVLSLWRQGVNSFSPGLS